MTSQQDIFTYFQENKNSYPRIDNLFVYQYLYLQCYANRPFLYSWLNLALVYSVLRVFCGSRPKHDRHVYTEARIHGSLCVHIVLPSLVRPASYLSVPTCKSTDHACSLQVSIQERWSAHLSSQISHQLYEDSVCIIYEQLYFASRLKFSQSRLMMKEVFVKMIKDNC